MSVQRPLKAVIFIYEIIRFLLLALIISITPQPNGDGALSPYLVYLSVNALFPLMALFIWLNPEEYKNYLTLYMAGKIIGTVSFFIWEIFGSRNFTGGENIITGIIILGGIFFISFMDILSVWGALVLKKNIGQRAEV